MNNFYILNPNSEVISRSYGKESAEIEGIQLGWYIAPHIYWTTCAKLKIWHTRVPVPVGIPAKDATIGIHQNHCRSFVVTMSVKIWRTPTIPGSPIAKIPLAFWSQPFHELLRECHLSFQNAWRIFQIVRDNWITCYDKMNNIKCESLRNGSLKLHRP